MGDEIDDAIAEHTAFMLTDIVGLIQNMIQEASDEKRSEAVEALEDLEDQIRARWEL